MEREIIQAYIDEHKKTYTSKYKFKSFFRKAENVYKLHYYTRDNLLNEINLFVEISLYDDIQFHFTEDINDIEKGAIAVDALEKILLVHNKTTKSLKDIKDCLKQKDRRDIDDFNDYDLLLLFYHILYHNGINQKAIDILYNCYLPHYNHLIEIKNFKRCFEEIAVLFDVFMYEIFWTGAVYDYLDQQYYYHLYYLKCIFETNIKKMPSYVLTYIDLLEPMLNRLFSFPRFTLCLISIIDDLHLSTGIGKMLLNAVENSIKDDTESKQSLPARYLFTLYNNDKEQETELVQEIFCRLKEDIIRLQNHDMQLALGNYFIDKYGFELLISTFAVDYDAQLLKAFEIEEIPEQYHEKLITELKKALHYYAKQIDQAETRIRAIEQIKLINRIILEKFKSTMYKE